MDTTQLIFSLPLPINEIHYFIRLHQLNYNSIICTMIPTPICQFSKRPSTKFCVHQNCELPAFFCSSCTNDCCEIIHAHNQGKITFVKWAQVYSLIEQLKKPPHQLEKQNLYKLLDQEKNELQLKLDQVYKDHKQSIEDIYNKLQFREGVTLTIQKIEQKRTEEINGSDMNTLYDALNYKNYFSNDAEVTNNAQQLTTKFSKRIQNIRDLFMNFASSEYELIRILPTCSTVLETNDPDTDVEIIQSIFPQKTHTIQQLNKIIDQHPKNHSALLKRAILYDNKKLLQQAEADYAACIEINPKCTEAYFNRGILLKNQKKLKNAQADFKKALSLEPRMEQGYYQLAEINILNNNKQKAISNYNNIIKIRPDCHEIYFTKAQLYMQLNKFEEAEINYSKAIDINPNQTKYFKKRAQCYWKRGNILGMRADQLTEKILSEKIK